MISSSMSWVLAAACLLQGCAAPAAVRRVSLYASEATFGGVDTIPQCNGTGDTLEFLAKGDCVVDRQQRVIVTDLTTSEVLLDTAGVNGIVLPHLPRDGFIGVSVQVRSLRAQQRPLLVQVSGACGPKEERASGAFQCDITQGQVP
jgi:hypothetical protein